MSAATGGEAAETAPLPRVAPITFPAADAAIGAPGAEQSTATRDAYRECRFALGNELNWLGEAFSLQRRIVEGSYPSRYRNHRYAAALLLWSRVYSSGIELARLTAWARYAACPPLVRASLDWLGAEQAVVGEEIGEFETWLRTAFQPNRAHSATEVGMGHYLAGQQVAMAADLAAIYRAAAELARPHFGASAVLVAPESNQQRLALHWGDESFHFGWAQLLFGWQIAVQQRQLQFSVGRGLFAVEAAERTRFQELSRQGTALLRERERCGVEWVQSGGQERLLLVKFRRQPSGAPKRLLL